MLRLFMLRLRVRLGPARLRTRYVVVGVVIGAVSLHGSSTRHAPAASRCECIDPVPIVTVEPAISPNVYRGGTVVTRVAIDKRGVVARVEVLSPVPALVEPVVVAVRQWQFAPATCGDDRVPGSTIVAVHVSLVRTVSTPPGKEWMIWPSRQHLNHDAAILCAACARRVRGNRILLAVADHFHLV